MARPTLLTADLAERFTSIAATGVSIADCCAAVGIDDSTFYKWQARAADATARWDNLPADDRDREQPYVEFIEGYTRARSRARTIVAGHLRRAAEPHTVVETIRNTRHLVVDGRIEVVTDVTTREREEWDWRAGLAFLERTDPDTWARRNRTEITGAGGGPVEVDTSALDRAKAAAAKLAQQAERRDRNE